ncbi:MAG TPA: hypothetical protein VFH48_16810 [Chloroflexota bacterium]|nr:hypothetical protein [Chloroflexota bacterium]
MRRIAVEIPLTIVAACLVASLVFVAGNAIGPSTPPVALAYTPQPALCTPSYCDPSEVTLVAAGSPEPQAEATSALQEAP